MNRNNIFVDCCDVTSPYRDSQPSLSRSCSYNSVESFLEHSLLLRDVCRALLLFTVPLLLNLKHLERSRIKPYTINYEVN
jgi:hypothetical protein